MENQILDDFNDAHSKKEEIVKLVVFAALITTGALLITHYLPPFFFSEKSLKWEGTKRILKGLFILLVILVVPFQLAIKLDRLDNSKSEILVGILGGATILSAQLLYKIILDIVILGNISEMNFSYIFKSSLLVSGLGFLISYHKIHTIRRKKTFVPRLLILCYFILFYLISQSGLR